MIPATAAAADTGAVTLGMRFRSSLYGTVTGVRYYRGSGNTGPHVGALWSSTGQMLAQGIFANETASGVQQLTFSSPVAINPNTAYVVSYYAPVGRYSFNTGFNWPVTAAPLTGEAGIFAYGATSTYPTGIWNASNYWVDVVFVPGEASPPPPPSTGTAALTWDAHTDARVTGYRIYSRQGNGPYPVTSVPVATNNHSFSALASGTWCFAVTAVGLVDGAVTESVQSVEACKTIP